ncbi:Rid family hydrolase [Variovorax ureilyticus]|uniref:Rid family hydrolase n=1 Tax=Variovorax ureilyticus TaxID=1836198 RepID=UPI003D67C0FB
MLALEGARREDIVSATIYLRTVGDYAAMNAIWDEWVPEGHSPARATVGAKLIDSDYKIEIQVVAAARHAGQE